MCSAPGPPQATSGVVATPGRQRAAPARTPRRPHLSPPPPPHCALRSPISLHRHRRSPAFPKALPDQNHPLPLALPPPAIAPPPRQPSPPSPNPTCAIACAPPTPSTPTLRHQLPPSAVATVAPAERCPVAFTDRYHLLHPPPGASVRLSLLPFTDGLGTPTESRSHAQSAWGTVRHGHPSRPAGALPGPPAIDWLLNHCEYSDCD